MAAPKPRTSKRDSPRMTKPDSSRMTLADRLALYRLEPPKRLDDLKVKDGQRELLSPTDARFQRHLQVRRPGSLQELKSWIGVPPGAVGTDKAPVGNLKGFVPTRDCSRLVPTPALHFGNRDLETKFTWALVNDISHVHDSELRDVNRLIAEFSIVALLFRDIYVGKNATLVCDDKVHVLLAHYITLDVGAQLEMQAPVSRIDCARIVSLRSRIEKTTVARGRNANG
jgi:hypothetical protein